MNKFYYRSIENHSNLLAVIKEATGSNPMGALEIPGFLILVTFEPCSSSLHVLFNWEFVLAHAQGQIKGN